MNLSGEKFCLKWNEFESNISLAFRDIRRDGEFFDVTLACFDDVEPGRDNTPSTAGFDDGVGGGVRPKFIQAHRVILSACSPWFRSMLRHHPPPAMMSANPVIYLRGIKAQDMEAILSFMYMGQVNVAQEQLDSFLRVAEDLKVKGLSQNNNKPNNSMDSDQHDTNISAQTKATAADINNRNTKAFENNNGKRRASNRSPPTQTVAATTTTTTLPDLTTAAANSMAPAAKRARRPSSPPANIIVHHHPIVMSNSDYDIKEIDLPSPIVKAEAKEIAAIGGGGGGIHSTTHDDIAADEDGDDSGSVGSGAKQGDGGFNNGSQDYTEETYDERYCSSYPAPDQYLENNGGQGDNDTTPGGLEPDKGMDRTSLFQYIVTLSEDNSSTGLVKGYMCQLCGKTMKHRYNLLSHVESKHFPNTFVYKCHICNQEMGTKNAHTSHMNQRHKMKTMNQTMLNESDVVQITNNVE
eukprot:TRINITY_DN11106_c1_g1_i1.p1 TRINITY_DN11106_c1_g1~~TRINITY_DN11106_c1_g1_i1.p1  ORF type:complete len:466 (-),score=142.67 TRINITY_DN11106_c1_g1_i1:648-2045(-)